MSKTSKRITLVVSLAFIAANVAWVIGDPSRWWNAAAAGFLLSSLIFGRGSGEAVEAWRRAYELQRDNTAEVLKNNDGWRSLFEESRYATMMWRMAAHVWRRKYEKQALPDRKGDDVVIEKVQEVEGGKIFTFSKRKKPDDVVN